MTSSSSKNLLALPNGVEIDKDSYNWQGAAAGSMLASQGWQFRILAKVGGIEVPQFRPPGQGTIWRKLDLAGAATPRFALEKYLEQFKDRPDVLPLTKLYADQDRTSFFHGLRDYVNAQNTRITERQDSPKELADAIGRSEWRIRRTHAGVPQMARRAIGGELQYTRASAAKADTMFTELREKKLWQPAGGWEFFSPIKGWGLLKRLLEMLPVSPPDTKQGGKMILPFGGDGYQKGMREQGGDFRFNAERHCSQIRFPEEGIWRTVGRKDAALLWELFRDRYVFEKENDSGTEPMQWEYAKIKQHAFNAAALNPASPLRDFFSKYLNQPPPTDYVPGSLLNFLFTIHDQKRALLIERLIFQGIIGRALTPGCSFPILIVLQGPGRAGKSLFVKMLCPESDSDDIKYYYLENYSLFEETRDPEKNHKRLVGRSVVEIQELTPGMITEVDALKSYTASESFSVRKLFEDETNAFDTTHITIATTNKSQPINFDETGNTRVLMLRVLPKYEAGEVVIRQYMRDRDNKYFRPTGALYELREKAFAYYAHTMPDDGLPDIDRTVEEEALADGDLIGQKDEEAEFIMSQVLEAANCPREVLAPGAEHKEFNLSLARLKGFMMNQSTAFNWSLLARSKSGMHRMRRALRGLGYEPRQVMLATGKRASLWGFIPELREEQRRAAAEAEEEKEFEVGISFP